MKIKRMLKVCISMVLLFGIIQFNSTAYGQTIKLEKKWETPAELREPESVLFDKKNNILYVSNINNPAGGKDGNGSIGKVALTGEIMEVEWVLGGMDAPKGMGLHNGLLYVADLTNVVVIDIKSGKVVNTIEVDDAGMLNDITVDEKGVVYISDSNKKRIYILKNNEAELWLENDVFKMPNGILAHKNKLYMIDMGTGVFYEINKQSKALNEIAKGLEGGDGIVPYGSDFIISIWNGELQYVSANGKIEKLIDTKAEKINAADIDYIPELNLLLVPTFFANTVAAYEIVK